MNAAFLQTTWLTTLTQALGWTLVHFVWQGALIALVLFLFVRLARNARRRFGTSRAVRPWHSCAVRPSRLWLPRCKP